MFLSDWWNLVLFEASNVMDGEESSGDHQMGCFQQFFVCKFFFTIQKGTTIFKQNGGCKDFQGCSLNFAKLKLVQKPVNFLFTISPNKIQRCSFWRPIGQPCDSLGKFAWMSCRKGTTLMDKAFFFVNAFALSAKKTLPSRKLT